MTTSTLLPNQGGQIDARWWLRPTAEDGDAPVVDEDEVHLKLGPMVRFLRDRQTLRRQYDLLHARLYGNLRFLGFGLNSHSQADGVEDDRITLNLSKNMIGAVVSRITKNRPKATVVTSDREWSIQARARKLELFLESQFYTTKFRKKAVNAFRDACIYGTGCLKVYRDERANRVAVERVPPWMLVVDDGECLTGEPRSIYERRYIDREVVLANFAKDDKELEEKIRDANLARDDDSGFGRDSTADQLLITEAWHLPSAPGAGDGRHSIILDNCTLLDEEYEGEGFPFVFIRWSEPPTGYFGIGLVAELIGLQAEVNKLLRQIQQAHHLCGWPRIFLRRGSKIVKQHINNEIGAIVEYDNEPPTQASFPVVPVEIYQHLQFLIKSAYEICGISQLSATSQKPPGIESGTALMTLQDVESDRFTEVGRAWEDLHADGAELMLRVAKECASHDKKFAVTAMGSDALESVEWAQAVMEVDDYRLQIFPTSMLPSTPAGRLQFVENLTKAGQMDAEDAFQLIDLPDTKAYAKRKRAGRDVIDRTLERMVYEGEYLSPEPFDNLEYTLKRAQEEYDLARLRNLPEDRLELLQRYMKEAEYQLGLKNPPPGPPPGPPMPPPGMGPPPMGPPPGGPPPPMPNGPPPPMAPPPAA